MGNADTRLIAEEIRRGIITDRAPLEDERRVLSRRHQAAARSPGQIVRHQTVDKRHRSVLDKDSAAEGGGRLTGRAVSVSGQNAILKRGGDRSFHAAAEIVKAVRRGTRVASAALQRKSTDKGAVRPRLNPKDAVLTRTNQKRLIPLASHSLTAFAFAMG